MIKNFSCIDDNLLCTLKSNCFSRRIRANFYSYGTEYNFCQFYLLEDNGMRAVINIFNSSMVIADFKNIKLNENDIEELSSFIFLNSPSTVEIPMEYCSSMEKIIDSGYRGINRVDFKFIKGSYPLDMNVKINSKLDDIYMILKDSFPAIENSYGLWLTDMSHRIRRNISTIFLMNDHTTATVHYNIDNVVYVGLVATDEVSRGKGHARALLYYMYDYYTAKGCEIHLFARSHRVEFYKHIGFIPVSEHIIFERK